MDRILDLTVELLEEFDAEVTELVDYEEGKPLPEERVLRLIFRLRILLREDESAALQRLQSVYSPLRIGIMFGKPEPETWGQQVGAAINASRVFEEVMRRELAR